MTTTEYATIFKTRIKFQSFNKIDSQEIYELMVDLSRRVPAFIYIEIEDENGEEIGSGQAGEDAK